MTKQQNIKPLNRNLLSTTLFILYTLAIIGSVAAGILSLSSLIPEKTLQANNSTNTTTNSRVFDQATISNVNNLTGSATGVPSGRSNPFSE